jgi:catechol 2,3-dioxygenase-like lactoylglutathione lyase family enzyme
MNFTEPLGYPTVSVLKNLVEVVLAVEDVARSMRFYNELLGLELISPPQAPVKFLRVGPAGPGIPRQIVLVPRSAAASTAPKAVLHHIGFEVAPEDFEAERQRLTAAGFRLRTGEHPFMPVEAFYLDDPDGNEVEIATWRGPQGVGS